MTRRRQVLIPLAPGYEETEAIATADVLSRAGIKPVLVSLPGEDHVTTGSHGLMVHTNASLGEVECARFVAICLPGGMPGTGNLQKCVAVGSAVRTIVENGGLVASLCAAPLVVQAVGLTDGKRLTSHPSVRDQLHGCTYVEHPVVVDPPLVTSRGPGTALLFGLTLVAGLLGSARALDLAEKMVVSVPEVVQNEWALFGEPLS